MVERFTVYPGVTYHTGQPHQNIKGEYVLYSDYVSLQKELAERTAERDFEAHVNKMLLSWAADNGCEPDLLLSEWMAEKARADTLARRVEGLEAALSRIADPRNIHFAGDAQIVARNALAHSAALKQKDGGNG